MTNIPRLLTRYEKKFLGFPTNQIPVIQVNDNDIDSRLTRLESVIRNLNLGPDLRMNLDNQSKLINELDIRVGFIERMLNLGTSGIKRSRTAAYGKKKSKKRKSRKSRKKSKKSRKGRFPHKKSRKKRR